MNNLENEIQSFKEKITTASALMAALEKTNNTILDSRQKLNEIDLLINKVESSTKTIFDRNIQDQKLLLDTNEIKISNNLENQYSKFEQTKNDLVKETFKLIERVEESEKILVKELKISEEKVINKVMSDYLDLMNKTNLSLEKTLDTLKSEIETYTNDIYSSEKELIDKLNIDNKALIEKTISDYKELIEKTSDLLNSSLSLVCSELSKTTESFGILTNRLDKTTIIVQKKYEELNDIITQNQKRSNQNFYILFAFISILLFFVISIYFK